MLAGDLTDLALTDVLRLLSTTSKTGVLEVVTDLGPGRVEVIDGRLRAATADQRRAGLARRLLGAGTLDRAALLAVLDGDGPLLSDQRLAEHLVGAAQLGAGEVAAALREHTIDAVLQLVRSGTGSFRFEGRRASDGAPASVTISVEELLGEVERRSAALDALDTASIPPGAVVTVVAPDRDGVAISADGWQLLALVDGERTVGELVELRGCGTYDTHRRLAELLGAGVVTTEQPGEETSLQRIVEGHRLLSALEARRTPTDDHPSQPHVPLAAPAEEPPPAARPGAATGATVTTLPARDALGTVRSDPSFDADALRQLIAGVEALP